MRILKTLLIITRRQANDMVDQYPMDYEVSE